jgi:hypothetical protein
MNYFQALPRKPIMPVSCSWRPLLRRGYLTIASAENFGKLAYFMSAENVKWRKRSFRRHGHHEVDMVRSRGKIAKPKGFARSMVRLSAKRK